LGVIARAQMEQLHFQNRQITDTAA